MRKKICPVCDRELTAAGYCKLCRRLVLRPLVREIDYYLNETPPGEGAVLNRKTPGGRPEPSENTGRSGKLERLYEEARRQAEELAGENRKIQIGKKRSSGTGSPGRPSGTGNPGRASGTGNPGRTSGIGNPGRAFGTGTPGSVSGTGSSGRTDGGEILGSMAGRERGSGRKTEAASGSGQGLNQMFGRPGKRNGRNAGLAKPRRENSEKTKGAAVVGVIVLCIVLLNALPLIANLFYGKARDVFVKLEPEPGWEDGAFVSGGSADGPDGWGTGMESGEDGFGNVEAVPQDGEDASENADGEPKYEEFITTHGALVPKDQEEGESIDQGITAEPLDEAQIRAAGVRCPDLDHLRCTGESLDQGLTAALEQKGLTYGRVESSDNSRIESGGREYEYYNHYRDYVVWEEKGEPAVLMLINSDTVTDEVHSVSVNAYSPDSSELAAEIMAWTANLAAEGGNAVTPQEILSAVAEESYVDRSEYNYIIYGDDYEGAAMVMAPCGNWDETGDIH